MSSSMPCSASADEASAVEPRLQLRTIGASARVGTASRADVDCGEVDAALRQLVVRAGSDTAGTGPATVGGDESTASGYRSGRRRRRRASVDSSHAAGTGYAAAERARLGAIAETNNRTTGEAAEHLIKVLSINSAEWYLINV